MISSAKEMRYDLGKLSDWIVCALHLLGKGAIGKEGSFEDAREYWDSTGKDCTKCAYHDDCALMILEE